MADLDPRVLAALQRDLPLVERPFAALAEEVGVAEDELLDIIRGLVDAKVIRRFGARLGHRRLGFTANAMVVWQAPPERIEEVGRLFAAQPEVTHCYERPPFEDFPYNLYTMIHAREAGECEQIAARLAQLADVSEYQLLFSTREFKKSSPVYRVDGEEKTGMQ
jgi:DNA-binding Lrp family transcriptional regulator